MAAQNSKPARTARWQKIFRLIFMVLSVALLIWLLDEVGWEQIGSYALQLGWIGVFIILLLGILEGLFDAVAFRKAIGEPVSLFYMNVANQSGAFLNRIIPWEAGEVLKGALLRRKVSTQAAISGTIVWNYLFKFSKPLATLLAATTAWMFGSAELRSLAGWMVLASVLSFLPYVFWRVFIFFGVAGTFVKLAKLIRLVRRDPEKLMEKARNIDNVVRSFSKNNRLDFCQIIIFQMLGRFTSWVTVYAVLFFIDHVYDFSTTGMIWAGFMVIGYLVTILPAKLGATEASGWLLFRLLGLDPGLGLMTQCIMSLKALVINGGTALLINFYGNDKKGKSAARENNDDS